jgi:xanthine dehydrogenase accessory factor
MVADADSILEIADRWSSEGRRLAWATVVSTWSSSPRPLGSQLLISDDGRFAGSVSGGCVEAAVIQAAAELLAGGPPQALRYGVSTEQAWDVGLPCGGKIEVFLAATPEPLLKRLVEAQRTRTNIAYLTDLGTGEQEPWEPGKGNQLAPEADPLGQAVARAVQQELSQLVEVEGRRVFVHLVGAPLRLVVVGAVHLTQALASLAELAGFELIVVDPRTAFATTERFPRAALIHDWPDVALDKLQPDRRTAVVVLSHDAKLDEPALVSALRSECFYIGALGSRRTQQTRRHRLAEAGFSEAELDRIHGPVGLDIGALTTPEMAIAIMGEIIQARRRPLRPQ